MDDLISSDWMGVVPREVTGLSHPEAGLAGTASDIVVLAGRLRINVVDAEQ
jgi:hypothetical protein